MNLPDCFCWTRFGTEAAQTVEQIFSRKEEERLANDGTFLWGIGNAIGPSVGALLRRTSDPEVLFSPIKGPPKSLDVAPASVVAWALGETLDGSAFALPQYSLVTSRYNPCSPGRVHYALVCYSERPLGSSGAAARLEMGGLRNLVTGRRVGASQVTAVVQRDGPPAGICAPYPVAVRAKLVKPYFIRLRSPVLLAQSGSTVRLSDIVTSLWESRLQEPANPRRLGEVSQRELAFNS